MSTSLENYRFFPPLFPFFIVWIESNKDSFLFDVIKLLRPDLGVRVNFSPKHRRELSDFRCQTLFQASQHLVFPPQVKGRFEEEEKKKQKHTLICPHCPTPSPAQLLWTNSPPHLDTGVPQAAYCAAVKTAHL